MNAVAELNRAAVKIIFCEILPVLSGKDSVFVNDLEIFIALLLRDMFKNLPVDSVTLELAENAAVF